MDRRVGGMFLLVLVLVGALVAGHWAPKRLPGRAVLGPIPGPPKVGSCLVQDPGDQGWAYDPNSQYAAIPSLRFDETCRGRHYGEVVAVLPAQLPVVFTQCTSDPTLNGDARPCDTPHTVEMVGYGLFLGAAPPSSTPDKSCLTLVKQLTVMPDVTAGGRLKVDASLQRFAPNGDQQTMNGPQPADSSEVGYCTIQVVGKGRLTASLIGLGSRRVPLSS